MASGSGFAGGVMIGCGLLIALLFGACSVFFAFSIIDQIQSHGWIDWDVLGPSLMLGFGPFAFGVLLIVLGIRMLRKRD